MAAYRIREPDYEVLAAGQKVAGAGESSMGSVIHEDEITSPIEGVWQDG
ncbi:hypothetical protein [Natronogracilivirga saccharolytica]|uniref:Uncharacterized protein n=1 Tax=Natronogracilivirga saccharolytica TaxID=2812953 RepID=A0A8J7RLG0_9BACT|nr:hypothetical protein [Natronogracilivirga saccharolytica]MBP3191854.1 hypothetical protein [Natronogracilivirga saccharolytica]